MINKALARARLVWHCVSAHPYDWCAPDVRKMWIACTCGRVFWQA